MTLSAFQKGALTGALSTILMGMLLVWGLAMASIALSSDEPPDPSATRDEVRGEFHSRIGQQVCVSVEGGSAEGGDPRPPVCGTALNAAVPDTLVVGDDVVGDIVEVEMDPGSGSHWSLWYSLTRRSP